MKHLYVVLGMARSGTSAISRGLQAIGIELGDNLTPANKRWNAKGFFEDNEIVYNINRTALHLIDSPWGMRPLAKAAYSLVTLDKLQDYAIRLLTERMQGFNYWGFKDPRTATLLPFWQPVFQTLNVEEHYVIALRNPLASAISYQTLSNNDLEEILIMWLMHTVPAVEGTHGKNRVLVNYELLMQDARHELNRIQVVLNIPPLTDAGLIDEYVNQFLDKKLQHYQYSEAEMREHPALKAVPLAMRVYDVLLKIAKDEMTFDDPAFQAAWAQVMEEFNQLMPLYDYVQTLLKKNKLQEREIRTIHKSLVWKLVYPLRVLDDFFRARRRKIREKRRLRYATER